MVKKTFRWRHILSTVLTFFVIFLLIFSGTVSAVIISISTDKSSYDVNDDLIVFTVQVDIESKERIPIKNLTLNITGPNSFSKICIFTPFGTKLTSCSNLEITIINVRSYGYGDMFGYGFGYDFGYGQWNTKNQTFGYGYGYGYESGYEYNSSYYAELAYNVTWNISAESSPLDSGSYSANLEVFTEKDSNTRIYKSTTSTDFSYKKPPTFSLNSTNTTLAGRPTEFRLKWNDDVGLSGYIFSISNCTSAPGLGDTETVNLQCPDNETLEDVEIYLGSFSRILFKFNLSSIPNNAEIDEAFIYVFSTSLNNWDGDVNVWRIDNQAWTEDDDFDSLWTLRNNKTNQSSKSSGFCTGSFQWCSINVTDAVITDYESENTNVSFWLEDPDNTVDCNKKVDGSSSGLTLGGNLGGMFYMVVRSKESSASSQRPYLKITYTTSGPSYVNDTWVSFSGTENWSNVTKTVNSTLDCTIRWKVYANNSFNVWNTSQTYSFVTKDIDKPAWSSNSSYSPTYYSSTSSQLNISWKDNVAISKVLIEIKNSTGSLIVNNKSMTNIDGDVYSYSIVLSAGAFMWKSYANNTAGNWNASDSWSFAISKAPSEIHLALNGTEGNRTYNYPEGINATGWIVTGLNYISTYLLRNGSYANTTLYNQNNAFQTIWNESFTRNENKTFYMSIPTNATIINARMSFKGYGNFGNKEYLSNKSLSVTSQSVSGVISQNDFIDWLNVSSQANAIGMTDISSNQDAKFSLIFSRVPISIKLSFAVATFSSSDNWDWVTYNISVYNYTSSSWVSLFNETTEFRSARECGVENFTIDIFDDYISNNVMNISLKMKEHDATTFSASCLLSWTTTCDGEIFTLTGSPPCGSQGALVFSRIYQKLYPYEPYLDVGIDGDIEWSYFGKFNLTNSQTSEFSTETMNYLSGCTPNGSGNCDIPFVLHSDTSGKIQISSINITVAEPNVLEKLAAGTYNYTYVYKGNQNYSSNSTTYFATVSQTNSSCSLTGISNHTYGTPDTIICSCVGDGTTYLYQNNIQRNEWNNTARVYENGTYTWVCNITAGISYTSASNKTTQVINISNRATGTYTNNTISTIANALERINATTTSNSVIDLQILTTSNVTNSTISITDYSSEPPTTTSITNIGICGLNKFFDINLGSTLNLSLSWILINISYTDSEVTAAGLDENSLKLYHYNTSSSSWEEVGSGGVNNVSKYVWGNLTSFSSYGLGGLRALGKSCSNNSNCYSGYCVHGYCRASSTYCGDGYCDSGETSSNCPVDCQPSLGGATLGGAAIAGEECTYNWECSEWSECIDGAQTRTCINKGTCIGTKGKPEESRSCVVLPAPTNITPPAPTTTLPTPSTPPTPTPTPTVPLGLGAGLIMIIIVLAIILMLILSKRKKIKKKQNLRVIS